MSGTRQVAGPADGHAGSSRKAIPGAVDSHARTGWGCSRFGNLTGTCFPAPPGAFQLALFLQSAKPHPGAQTQGSGRVGALSFRWRFKPVEPWSGGGLSRRPRESLPTLVSVLGPKSV